MKRGLAYLVGLVLVAAAMTMAIVAVKSKDTDKKADIANNQSQPVLKFKTACNIFSLADAKQLLGANAKGGTNPIYNSMQNDLAVSSCTYTQDSGSNAPIASSKSATLLVRSPKTDKGAISNSNQFSVVKPADVQDVSGYGDTAYWDNAHAQLDILKNNNWYVLTYGPVTRADRTLDQTKQLADLLIAKI
jgi:hypothetical protein